MKNGEGGGDDDEHFQKIQNEKDAIDPFWIRSFWWFDGQSPITSLALGNDSVSFMFLST